MKKKTISMIVAVCCMAVAAEMRPLVDLAADVEKAKQDINAAIQAMGGEGSGGLTNASKRILAIPLPSGDYEQTYVAWSNAARTVRYPVTNGVYRLVEWLQSTKSQSQYINLNVFANQDTYAEVAVSNVTSISSEHQIFGDRYNSSHRYGVHFYSSQVSFPYYNQWNDFKASALPAQTKLMVIKMDANMMYVDGNLVFTASKVDFKTDYPLCVFLQNGSINDNDLQLEGNLLWMMVKRGVNSSNNMLPDKVLLPAIDENDRPCLLDIAASPCKPYYVQGNGVQYSSPTNTLYDISWIEFEAICPEPYETNVVGNAENKLIEDDAIRYMYQKMSPAE